MTEWLCVGGPLHGRWRPSGLRPIAAERPEAPVNYAVKGLWLDGALVSNEMIAVSVAVPPRPILYYPARLHITGWRFALPFFLEARLAAGLAPLDRENGMVLPGGIVGMPVMADVACRLCYGRAMNPEVGVCSRVSCITAVAAIESLDHLTADDAKGWADDDPMG
jgi:hypothetical protein